MKYLSEESSNRIYQILTDSRENCNRTVETVCAFADYTSRISYYNVVNGTSHDPANYIKIGIGANVPASLFAEYLEAANIILSPKFSKENRLFWEYLENHSTERKTNYDLEELRELVNHPLL